ATGAGSATSAAFNITAGTATQLVFSVQPTTTAAGAAITPAVQVTAQDAQGNTATGFTGNVTVAIGTNPGAGTLGGTEMVADGDAAGVLGGADHHGGGGGDHAGSAGDGAGCAGEHGHRVHGKRDGGDRDEPGERHARGNAHARRGGRGGDVRGPVDQ